MDMDSPCSNRLARIHPVQRYLLKYVASTGAIRCNFPRTFFIGKKEYYLIDVLKKFTPWSTAEKKIIWKK